MYAANPDAEFDVNDGVLCLIGANGVGKSTLLAAINFCMTGIVSDPDRKFESIDEYYEYSLRHSARFFTGRIDEHDRADAEIALEFRIADHSYQLRRGIFEAGRLREFRVISMSSGAVLHSGEEQTPAERQQHYAARLASDVGLATFPEFVFLQHFVFTFDERRVTLFWNQRVLETVLYLAFGIDTNIAKKVDQARRQQDAADSQVRNRQWDATKLSKRINDLRAQQTNASVKKDEYAELASQHEALTVQYDQEVRTLDLLVKQTRDAGLRLSTRSARQSSLRKEYSELFDRGFRRHEPLAQHPMLVRSLTDHACAFCGETGEAALTAVRKHMDGNVCPICSTHVVTIDNPEPEFDRLKVIDTELAKTQEEVDGVVLELDRLNEEETSSRDKVDAIKGKLDEFARQHEATMSALRLDFDSSGKQPGILESYKEQLAKILAEKKDAEKRRAEHRENLATYQKQLQLQYVNAEQKFVPAFTTLAHLFLGMDLHIRMEASEGKVLSLIVEVRGTARRLAHNLSESQRFFLDIALRMALVQFISDTDAKGCLFIDTPEGSLDIAYEKRAGEMIASFVKTGHHVLMTANLNSSKLLLSLSPRIAQRPI